VYFDYVPDLTWVFVILGAVCLLAAFMILRELVGWLLERRDRSGRT